MKNLRVYCILLFNLVVLAVAVAQSVPFVEEGKTWTMEYFYGPMFDRHSRLEKLTMEGDTIIGDRKWKKVYCTGAGARQLVTAMYEEEGKVYFLPYAGATEGALIYDFSLKAGDEVAFRNACCTRFLPGADDKYYEPEGVLKVISTEEQVYEGIERKCLSLYALGNGYEYELGYYDKIDWIEGVGNTSSSPLDYVSMFRVGGDFYGLVECRVGDRVLHKNGRVCFRPFVEEGKTWRVESRTAYDMLFDTDAPSTFWQYVIEGDTIIGGRTWKKLYLIQEETGQKTLLSALFEKCEGESKVYFLPYAGAEEGRLLYDFDLKAGEMCNYYNLNHGDCLPTKEEYVEEFVQFPLSDTYIMETDGNLLQAFRRSASGQLGAEDFYVEALGNVTRDPFMYYSGALEGGDATHVVECSVGNNILYKAALWKDPAVGIEKVRVEGSEANDGAVYDLSGRRLNGVPKSGMYIRNGRKYLVR